MESITLTPGAILKMTSEKLEEGYEPILQVLEVKKIQTAGQDVDRYKVALWDGSRQQHGMLGTQLNSLVNQGKLQKGSFIRLQEYTCTLIQGRPIIIIISLDVLVKNCQDEHELAKVDLARMGAQLEELELYMVVRRAREKAISDQAVAADFLVIDYPSDGEYE